MRKILVENRDEFYDMLKTRFMKKYQFKINY